ncbi:MAG: hypothetical protein JNM74_23335, partial [Myxococcales bacterium]|nr:hypothetical protein [Myxococcales bacterium]
MRAHTIVTATLLATGITAAIVVGCENKAVQQQQQASGNLGASTSVADLMKSRGLSEADVEAALKTYVPTGKMDEY